MARRRRPVTMARMHEFISECYKVGEILKRSLPPGNVLPVKILLAIWYFKSIFPSDFSVRSSVSARSAKVSCPGISGCKLADRAAASGSSLMSASAARAEKRIAVRASLVGCPWPLAAASCARSRDLLAGAHWVLGSSVASTRLRYAVTASLSHLQDGSNSCPAIPRRACNWAAGSSSVKRGT